MFRFLILVLFVFWSPAVFASTVHFPEPVSSGDYIEITDLQNAGTYYGTFSNYPHTYFFVVTESTPLTAEVMVPDIEEVDNNRGIIVVRHEQRGVSEVTRVRPQDATWESFKDTLTAERYRRGGKIETTLEPGSYLLEVQTPLNEGPYVLHIGQKKDFSIFGYFKTVGEVRKVKKFLGKPGIAVMQSPLVYVPLVLLLAIGFWFWRKKKHHA